MTDKPRSGPDEIPKALIETPRRLSFSIVWLVPLVAVLIGGWLTFKALSERGPTVEITFRTAAGLEAGKTKIKFKDIEVGMVESIGIAKDLSHVTVMAELEKAATPYLTEQTRFWVVRPRVTAAGVTGISTLFSGAYIGMDPGRSGAPQRKFEGLETPPLITSDSPGQRYRLQAESLGSVGVGSPVYFRSFEVGEVESHELDPDGRGVTIKIFVFDPYYRFITKGTRFWNASGVNLTLDATGVTLDTESLVSIIAGGIAFETFSGNPAQDPAEENAVFTLYRDRLAATTETFKDKQRWLLYFRDSVRGLTVGAPVEFRGIKIGEVVDIDLVFDVKQTGVSIPVLIAVEPERFRLADPDTVRPTTPSERKKVLTRAVANGLRAQLEVGSLLTGARYINFDFHQNVPPARINWVGAVPEIPTLPATRALIVDSLREGLVTLNATLKQVDELANNLNAKATPALTEALEQSRKTLKAAEDTLHNRSAIGSELREALEEVAKAARSIRLLTEYLERQPEALIRGKGDSK